MLQGDKGGTCACAASDLFTPDFRRSGDSASVNFHSRIRVNLMHYHTHAYTCHNVKDRVLDQN